MNNRFVVWGLAFSFGLNMVLVGMVASHLMQGSWTPPPKSAAAAPRSPATHVLQFNENRLKLTALQREQFRIIREGYFNEEKQAKAQGVERIAKLSACLVRNETTTASLRPIFRDIRDHSDDFFRRLTRALQAYRAVLTPDQRVVFNQMLQERFAALQRFSRQRSFEYEQFITETIQRDRKLDPNFNKKGQKKNAAKKGGDIKKPNDKKNPNRKADKFEKKADKNGGAATGTSTSAIPVYDPSNGTVISTVWATYDPSNGTSSYVGVYRDKQ